MTENFIPMFKKSGDGVANDILKLKKLEAISDGWYRGQLINLMNRVAGKTIIDGVLCYDTNIPINGRTSLSDQSQIAKDTRRLLKLFGLSDATLAGIYNTYTSGDVYGIFFTFNKEENLEKVYTMPELKKAIVEIKKIVKDVSKFEFIHTNAYYGISEEWNAKLSSDIYNYSAWGIDYNYYGELEKYEQEIDPATGNNRVLARDFSLGQAMYFSKIRFLDELGNDITINYMEEVVNAMKVLILMSGQYLLELESLTKTDEFIIETQIVLDEEGGLGGRVAVVESKEVYNNVFKSGFAESQYYKFEGGPYLKVMSGIQNDYGFFKVNGILANHLWTFFAMYEYYNNDKSDDLFYIQKKQGLTGNYKTSYKRYMRVEGLKNANINSIMEQVARWADFDIYTVQKKKKFLGVGGFIGSFLGSFFNMIINLVTQISKVLWYVPTYRLSVQFIGWVFSGEWSNNKDRGIQISNRILLAIVAVVIVILTGGSGWQIALSIAMSAYGMYTGIEEYDEAIESAERQLKYRTTPENENKLNEKLIDLSNSEAMAEAKKQALYKPFDAINKTYASPFDGNSVYNPKFGI